MVENGDGDGMESEELPSESSKIMIRPLIFRRNKSHTLAMMPNDKTGSLVGGSKVLEAVFSLQRT